MNFESPSLEPGAVHVWRAALRPDRATVDLSSAILSADEAARARRFRFERDRDRFITARATLRRLLSHYAGVGEREICFRYLEKGKPEIDAPSLSPPLRFNVSHSADWGVFAFSRDGDLGVDIEEMRADRDLLGIATRFFCPRENAWLREGAALRSEELVRRFFTLWTRKEAYLKARGVGITVTLEAIDVSRGGADGRVDVRVDSDEPADESWHVLDLPAPTGFRAALATARPVLQLESLVVA